MTVKGILVARRPYEKIKVWVHLRLNDGRLKNVGEKRVAKTFRLRPQVIEKLKQLAKESSCTDTEALEKPVLG